MAKDILFEVLERINRLNKAILILKHFGIEESVESYLISFPNRSKAQALRYAHRRIDPQIKLLNKEIKKAKEFVKLYNEFSRSKSSSISSITSQEIKSDINVEMINVI